ncbi:uncharacterized protein LOC128467590 [Spea bombifrons]|uniref:uncharacterized protein LOC128467590 n=1 Tax=Spea bombifrons TaxID=233779 RepID=UPI00234948EA|nr:uncharacterized protein LOC128467590 [Spea bombifrons]
MASYHVLILCFCVFTAASGSHMQGGLMTFRARERNYDGTFVVEFKYKAAFIDRYGYEFYWYCSGWDCGYDVYRWHGAVPTSVSNAWYQTEGYIIRHLHNDKPFQLTESSCCWVYNSVGASGWNLVTGVDLGTRSDTFKPNNSPVTNIIPVIRVPNNCQSYINLLAFDPDGDIVRCRYGQYWAGECSNCNQPPKIYLDEARCSLSIPSAMPTGTYVLELVLEDFPRNNIYLRYNDGSIAYKYRPYNSKSGEVPKNSRWNYWDSTPSSYTDVSSQAFPTTQTSTQTSTLSETGIWR